MAVAIFFLTGIGATAWYLHPGALPWLAPLGTNANPILALPKGPSIAVLPFANLSGDPGQEYFTDGITEEIITELTRFHDLFVIGRNTTPCGKRAKQNALFYTRGSFFVTFSSIARDSSGIPPAKIKKAWISPSL